MNPPPSISVLDFSALSPVSLCVQHTPQPCILHEMRLLTNRLFATLNLGYYVSWMEELLLEMGGLLDSVEPGLGGGKG